MNDIQKVVELNRDDTMILVIDIQDRLSKAMFNEEKIKKNTKILLELAKIYSLPVAFTEQNPKSLGNTNESLANVLDYAIVIGKMGFSAYTKEIEKFIKVKKVKNIVITGMETHVCVYQTVRELIKNGYNVTLASDAVGSRSEFNYHNAIELMRDMGCIISNTESILFDIIKTSTDENFKPAQKLII